ncbi:tyrosine-type recombinase/integrase [Deinococcus koreensis]|uniref:Tyr recombinase domain-containing protein n=1 Tax=Deinococcus koreensis TaxID=2054903 RepID=A0A2K3UYP6_9DEIO|nr:tyrosine-type recombinase/integrase [Deinococcus koreensis]PNY81653.1 hypothetical protein CVO96_09965 [Deinococcus koreensis]
MAQIDSHFEAFLAERRQQQLSPAGERLFRDAWTVFRRLPGSYRADPAAIRAVLRPDRRWGRHDLYRLARGLSQILTWLRDRRVIPASLDLTSPSPRSVMGPQLLTDPSIARLLRRVDDLGVRTLAYLVYHTGLRAQTLITMKREHVNLATRTLTVPGRDGGPDVQVGFSQAAGDALRLWFLRRRKNALYLFHDATAMPLTLRYASRVLRQAGATVGLPAIGFGELQYSHLRLLALRFPEVDETLIEARLHQPFRLHSLRLPYLLYLAGEPRGAHDVLSMTKGVPR